MKEQTFIETMIPKIGLSAIANANTAQLTAIRELLIEKGIINRLEFTAEVEAQLGKLAEMIMKMPIPSPIQSKS